jgi:hypothetical protein
MELTSVLGWLMICSIFLMNTNSFSFVIILFSSLCIISVLFRCNLWSSYHYCSAILDLDISPIFVLRLCSVILMWSGHSVSPIYFFLHSHEMQHIQFFVSWILFWGLVFVSMFHNLNAVRIPNFSPIVGICSDVPRTYDTTTVYFVVFKLVGFCFWLFLWTLFMNLCGYPFAANVTLKVSSFFFKMSFVRIAIPFLCRYYTTPFLVLCGRLEVQCRYCPVWVSFLNTLFLMILWVLSAIVH